MSGRGRGGGRGFIRFQSSGASIPPPPSLLASTNPTSRKGFTPLAAIHKATSKGGDPLASLKVRHKTEDEYFDSDEDEGPRYQPAPGSPSAGIESDEDDPLDAFMSGIESEMKRAASAPEPKPAKGSRVDIEDMDDEESYYKFMAENPDFGKDVDDSDNDLEYDEDGNPLPPITSKKKHIDPLPPIDHSTIEYMPFEKNFYSEHPDITKLTDEEVEQLRKTLGIKVNGASVPKPVCSFLHLGFPEILMRGIRKSEFTQPTPIQAQGIPIVMSGRDIIGIAKTGSGKTAAFLWPMLIHMADQRLLKPGDGPIGLVLCPTRELALQIYNEAKKFGKLFNFTVCCCYGGGSKWEQSKALENGADIVVATPGRMIDLIKIKATNLSRVTFLVLDECDRMFDMGFSPQVQSICAHVRPDKQCLLFSATFRKKVEKLARVTLNDPIRVVQGEIGEASEDVDQQVLVMPIGGAKWKWLLDHLVEFTAAGSVLIFVTKKANAEELYNNLKLKEVDALLLHGDMDQIDRNKVIGAFRKKEVNILVATDVAARGLDIPHIRTVINYDIARDIDTHTHRIGRTGRAGEKGNAFTLITEKDFEFAGHLVRNLEGAGQPVPQTLLDLALKSAWFRNSRFTQGKGKNAAAVGTCRGLGFSGESSSVQKFKSTGVLGSSMSSPSLGSGTTFNRLDAIKAAFKKEYMSNFKASADNAIPPPQPAVVIPPLQSQPNDDSSSKRKRSRWN